MRLPTSMELLGIVRSRNDSYPIRLRYGRPERTGSRSSPLEEMSDVRFEWDPILGWGNRRRLEQQPLRNQPGMVGIGQLRRLSRPRILFLQRVDKRAKRQYNTVIEQQGVPNEHRKV